MRLTKFNPESGQYEYIEKAKTLDEVKAQRKAVIQRLGEYEDKGELDDAVAVVRCKDCTEWNDIEKECSHWYGFRENDYCSYGERREE